VFLTDFIEVFEQNGKRHKDWDATFKVFIRRASPEGPFYGYGKLWERRCEQAKGHRGVDARQKSEINPSHDRKSTWVPTVAGRETLKHIRDILGK
jgi:hypothetical protein